MQKNWEQIKAWHKPESQSPYERLAIGLGCFSIGLGLAEVMKPGAVAQLAGVADDDRNRSLLRSPFYGLRELTAGVGILSQRQPAGWMWSRVAGDMLDIGTLAAAYRSGTSDKKKVSTALAAVIGVTALDLVCAAKLSGASSSSGSENRQRTTRVITVNASLDQVYSFWRDFENLPRFMKHLESVETGDGRWSRWRAKGPGGKIIEWEAEMIEDRRNERISWQSTGDADVQNSGTVWFEPASGGRGTVVRVDLQYDAPGGSLGKALAKLTGAEPGQLIDDDLRAFKQVIETGEVVSSDASIHSGMHPAQPPEKVMV